MKIGGLGEFSDFLEKNFFETAKRARVGPWRGLGGPRKGSVVWRGSGRVRDWAGEARACGLGFPAAIWVGGRRVGGEGGLWGRSAGGWFGAS